MCPQFCITYWTKPVLTIPQPYLNPLPPGGVLGLCVSGGEKQRRVWPQTPKLRSAQEANIFVTRENTSQDRSGFLAETVLQCDTSLAGDEGWTLSFLTLFLQTFYLLLSPPLPFQNLKSKLNTYNTETCTILIPQWIVLKNINTILKIGAASCMLRQRYFYRNKHDLKPCLSFGKT